MADPLNPEIQDTLDYDTTRKHVYNNMLGALQTHYPIENEKYKLELNDLRYEGPEHFSLADQKNAILQRKTLYRPIRGTWQLTDKATSQPVDTFKSTIAHVPYLTQRSTYIINGIENSIANQLRLKSGVYTRQKENGEYEAHFNVLRGGPGFRVDMEPKTGVFRMHIGQAKLKLYPILKAMGKSDKELQDKWGPELFNANMSSADDKGTLERLWERLADNRSKKETNTPAERDFKKLFEKIELDPEVTQRTLGERHPHVTADTLMRVTNKLTNIAKGTEDTDDRDSMAFQETWGAPELMSERISKDAGRLGSRLLWRATLRGNLSGLPSAALNPQVESVFYKSGVAQALEEISPLGNIDQNSRVTRMGEGGMSADAIPEDSRMVQPSHFGFVDPVNSPECFCDVTEVMTETGWKYWKDVTLNDRLACNITGSLGFYTPIKLIVEQYIGVMYGIKTEGLDMLVTPNHRMWVCPSVGSDFDFELITDCIKENRMYATLSINPFAYETAHPADYYTVDYNGMVYCAEVPGHLLFTRRNGSAGVWSGNSGNVGVDLRLATDTYKGTDKQLYSKMINVRTGKPEHITPLQAVDSVIAFPGELAKARAENRTHVRAMAGGKLSYVSINKVQYEAPSAQGLFSHSSNLIPMAEGMKPGRLLMAAKHSLQALPLKDAEVPLVQSQAEDGTSYISKLGKHMGIVNARVGGQVTNVTPDSITVQGPDGKPVEHDLYNAFPLNRKTFLHSTPLVKPGDLVSSGQLLAHSNFTDKNGSLAIGKNLRVGYIPWKSGNHEDAIVISESAAQKLSSEHMFTAKVDKEDYTHVARGKFMSIFPSVYNKAQLLPVADSGVVKRGTVVNKNDPLILAVKESTSKGAGQLYHGAAHNWQDNSVKWEHDFPGVVTDVWNDEDGVKLAVKAYAPTEVGDKLANRFAAKGVVGRIEKDSDMPTDSSGKPLEILMNPMGVISRINPSQLFESVLGKIAAKRGSPYMMKNFSGIDLAEFTLGEMKKYGVSDTEELTDPSTGRKIPKVLTGLQYVQKLSHTASSKESGRGLGAYSAEGIPSTDDEGNPKRIGLGEMQALISHGSVQNIQDIKTIRGQRNDDYWRAMTLGYTPPSPEIPMAYKKFTSLLQAAGINIKKTGEHLHLTAMTDNDVDAMSHGEIKDPSTVRWLTDYGRGLKGEKALDPVEGGLFDRGITGGHGGQNFSHLVLHEPMPQPAMEDPIKRLLNLSTKEYEEVIAGRSQLPNLGTGGKAIKAALERIQIDPEIDRNKELIKTANTGAVRDDAIKKLKYLETFKKTGINPSDLVITKVPILPPIFRPITANNKFEMVAGSNLLYMDLMHANKNLEELTKVAGGEHTEQARMTLYNSLKAVTGLGDPVRPDRVQHGIEGVLKEVFGSSPKNGVVQRKLLGTTVDLAARSVITPNSELDMDHVGIPEDQAWKLYGPFVTRRLIRQMGDRPEARAAAIRMVVNRDKRALEALQSEMEVRPILTSRAPALHRYSIMALKPVLIHGKTMQLSPAVLPGFNADMDGDAMNFHVVVSDKAIAEANKKLLPSASLRDVQGFNPLWFPRHEFQHGLYMASTKRSGRRMLPVFKNREEVLRGFRQGLLNVEDMVNTKDD